MPGALVITTFTPLGNVVLPTAFAFGILGRRLATRDAGSTVARELAPA